VYLSELVRLTIFKANAFAFSPDGEKLVVAVKDTAYLVDLWSLAYALYIHLTNKLENPDNDDSGYPHVDLGRDPPQWSPRTLKDLFVPLLRDDDADQQQQQQQQQQSRSRGATYHCAFSPDSTRILVARGTRLHLYDSKTATPLDTVHFSKMNSSNMTACHFLI